jgi:hypothetical protein
VTKKMMAVNLSDAPLEPQLIFARTLKRRATKVSEI